MMLPNDTPAEMKIWVAASLHTSTSFKRDRSGFRK